MNAYYSFLICHHETYTDVHINGVHVGRVDESGIFTPHEFKLMDGTTKPLAYSQIPDPKPETLEHLISQIYQILDNMRVGFKSKQSELPSMEEIQAIYRTQRNP